MINSIGSSLSSLLPAYTAPVRTETIGKLPSLPLLKPAAPEQSFGEVLSQAVNGVNDKLQAAEVEKTKVMSGETNNLHQAMLSIQEAGVAFSLMNEVRNKLVESYQEVMRMQV